MVCASSATLEVNQMQSGRAAWRVHLRQLAPTTRRAPAPPARTALSQTMGRLPAFLVLQTPQALLGCARHARPGSSQTTSRRSASRARLALQVWTDSAASVPTGPPHCRESHACHVALARLAPAASVLSVRRVDRRRQTGRAASSAAALRLATGRRVSRARVDELVCLGCAV